MSTFEFVSVLLSIVVGVDHLPGHERMDGGRLLVDRLMPGAGPSSGDIE